MRHKAILLAVAVVFQLLILGVMIGQSMLPLYTGKPVTLKVVPRDPRDLFRGNYVDLSYDFSNLEFDSANHPHQLDLSKDYRFGDKLYLSLSEKNGLYVPHILYDKLPDQSTEPLLKVTVRSLDSYKNWKEDTIKGKAYYHANLLAGIESYYTDPAEAKRLEKSIQGTEADSTVVTALVMIAPGGEARIKKLNVKKLPRKLLR